MDLEIVRLHRMDGTSKIKAFVDISIGGFVIKGLRVVEGKNGLFLGMPQGKAKDGKWYDSVYAADKETEQNLSQMVLAAYQA